MCNVNFSSIIACIRRRLRLKAPVPPRAPRVSCFIFSREFRFASNPPPASPYKSPPPQFPPVQSSSLASVHYVDALFINPCDIVATVPAWRSFFFFLSFLVYFLLSALWCGWSSCAKSECELIRLSWVAGGRREPAGSELSGKSYLAVLRDF